MEQIRLKHSITCEIKFNYNTINRKIPITSMTTLNTFHDQLNISHDLLKYITYNDRATHILEG